MKPITEDVLAWCEQHFRSHSRGCAFPESVSDFHPSEGGSSEYWYGKPGLSWGRHFGASRKYDWRWPELFEAVVAWRGLDQVAAWKRDREYAVGRVRSAEWGIDNSDRLLGDPNHPANKSPNVDLRHLRTKKEVAAARKRVDRDPHGFFGFGTTEAELQNRDREVQRRQEALDYIDELDRLIAIGPMQPTLFDVEAIAA